MFSSLILAFLCLIGMILSLNNYLGPSGGKLQLYLSIINLGCFIAAIFELFYHHVCLFK